MQRIGRLHRHRRSRPAPLQQACCAVPVSYTHLNDEITADIFEHLKGLEEINGKKFGDNQNPLLVSVRSGARQSMPGMMDTILNPVSYTHLDVYKRQVQRDADVADLIHAVVQMAGQLVVLHWVSPSGP